MNGTVTGNGYPQSEKGKTSGAKVEGGSGLKVFARVKSVCQRTRQGIASGLFKQDRGFESGYESLDSVSKVAA